MLKRTTDIDLVAGIFKDLGYCSQWSQDMQRYVLLEDGKKEVVDVLHPRLPRYNRYFSHLYNKGLKASNKTIINALISLKIPGTFNFLEGYFNTFPEFNGDYRYALDFVKLKNEDDYDLYKEIVQTWFRGAVYRGLNPGSRLDQILIYNGKYSPLSGVGGIFREISDTRYKTDKSSYFLPNGHTLHFYYGVRLKEFEKSFNFNWIIEIEIDGILRNKDALKLKRCAEDCNPLLRNWHTNSSLEPFPARHAICGSTEIKPFFDISGAESTFIIVDVYGYEDFTDSRDQFVAQLLHEIKCGKPTSLSDEEIQFIVDRNERYK